MMTESQFENHPCVKQAIEVYRGGRVSLLEFVELIQDLRRQYGVAVQSVEQYMEEVLG